MKMISIRVDVNVTSCLLFLWTLLGVTFSLQLPDELKGARCSQKNAILMPASKTCVVPVQTPMNWTQSQMACEQAGGMLYKLPASRLYSSPDLMDCLSSMEGQGFKDMWLNGISLWAPQFFWTNTSILNKVTYCPTEQPPANPKAPMTSDYLSVDYCVSTCYDQKARFTVLYTHGASPMCNCITDLDSKYMKPCSSPEVNYNDGSRSFIVHSTENSLVKVSSSDLFSATEVMCATVDSETFENREMNTDSCFSHKPFVCEIGSPAKCEEAQKKIPCTKQQCVFRCGNKCLKRVGRAYDWYAARKFCASLGGDLWNMDAMDDMGIVTDFLEEGYEYWIGASNYAWDFNAESKLALSFIQTYKNKIRCGHMYEGDDCDSINQTWAWSDGDCGEKRASLCQFDVTSSSNENQGFVCPWKKQVPKVSANHVCLKQTSIKMPSANKCFVPMPNPSSWMEAQTTCEKAGGSLYQMLSDRLSSRPELMTCLSSLKGSNYNTMWLNGVSLWSAQFIWTNTTIVNKVKYCPTEMPPTNNKAPLASDYLSLDYCVYTCNERGAKYTVLYTTETSPKCNCISSLDDTYKVPCSSPVFNHEGSSRYYIVEATTDSLIKISSNDLFSATEIMCATVGGGPEMDSDLCFKRKPFICELGPASKCLEDRSRIPCTRQQCLVTCGHKCLKRVGYYYNWYGAKRFCNTLGGDLWNVEHATDVDLISDVMDGDSRYWVGASNHAWNFNAKSSEVSKFTALNWKLRCGYMTRKSTYDVTSGRMTRTWTWTGEDCDKKKGFLCEYNFPQSTSSQDLNCPW